MCIRDRCRPACSLYYYSEHSEGRVTFGAVGEGKLNLYGEAVHLPLRLMWVTWRVSCSLQVWTLWPGYTSRGRSGWHSLSRPPSSTNTSRLAALASACSTLFLLSDTFEEKKLAIGLLSAVVPIWWVLLVFCVSSCWCLHKSLQT